MRNIYETLAHNALDKYKAASPSHSSIVEIIRKDLTIEVSGRMRTCAGKAGCKFRGIQRDIVDPFITLSSHVLSPLSDEEKYDTVSHEVAHIVDYYIRKNSGHDFFWQRIHRAMISKNNKK